MADYICHSIIINAVIFIILSLFKIMIDTTGSIGAAVTQPSYQIDQ